MTTAKIQFYYFHINNILLEKAILFAPFSVPQRDSFWHITAFERWQILLIILQFHSGFFFWRKEMSKGIYDRKGPTVLGFTLISSRLTHGIVHKNANALQWIMIFSLSVKKIAKITPFKYFWDFLNVSIRTLEFYLAQEAFRVGYGV